MEHDFYGIIRFSLHHSICISLRQDTDLEKIKRAHIQKLYKEKMKQSCFEAELIVRLHN